jgi:hypothetical protein
MHRFTTNARLNPTLECNIIIFDVTDMNGKPMDKMMSQDVIDNFWRALGFDTAILLTKQAQVCLLIIKSLKLHAMLITFLITL